MRFRVVLFILCALSGHGVVNCGLELNPQRVSIKFYKVEFNQKQVKRELDDLDFALDRLNKQRLLYRSQGLWYLDLGTRLQFKRDRFLESQRAFNQAELQFQAVEMIEKRIRFLEKRRQDVLNSPDYRR